ncbi:hypothetical protein [Flavobacterium sp. ov086]|uniref:hypothetical protein n=1 Tax=Flavobacterium sp. ov086 TaxID=1761785 RepID=UPI000B649AAB|nr:hypothetical protein [Flavobacterium sp. ov086]SNR96595.1 hypothetical protein SAMN04487979_13537 [Flavobacterium sp. ov086]
MKNKFLVLPILLFSITSFSQQIGEGFPSDVINDFSVPLKSGIYNGYNGSFTGFIGPTAGITPDVGNPWQHLFTMRHKQTSNNYQLQIASSFAVNDRLFFRKIVGGDLSAVNTAWVELATRGINTFTGNQVINGNVGIGTSDLTSKLSIGSNHGILLSIGNSTWANKSIIQTSWNSQSGDFTDLKVPGAASNDAYIRLIMNGNVGIGTLNPKNKLDVNGTIHSQEVKVDMLGWSDFVFKKEYYLPTLAEVEKHINEKGHLENIPSEEEVLKNGINLGEMNAKLLQKIEELTLYMINQNKSIEFLKEENKKQNEEIKDLKKTLVSK